MLQCPCYFASFFIFFPLDVLKFYHLLKNSFHDDKILVDFHGCTLRKIKGEPSALSPMRNQRCPAHALHVHGKSKKDSLEQK